MDYTWFYVEANIVSIVIFTLLLLRELGSIGHQSKQVVFINIIFAHIMYFLSDICWALILGHYLPPIPGLVAAANIINAIVLSCITGFWFVYAELSQGEAYIQRLRMRLLVMTPVLVTSVLILVLFIFFPGTVITEGINLTLTYYIVFLSVPVIYIIVSTVRSVIRAFRKENFAVRSLYLTSAAYPFGIAVIGVIQTLWLKIPMFCFGCSIMMLYVYISSLNDQVSLDELTKLNNRTQLKKYIANDIQKQNPGKIDRYVLMIDLNKFKHINDHYGHVEGDHAIKRAADALMMSCAGSPMKTFIARYGGDEFIVIVKTESEDQIKKLCSDIKETLIRLNTESGAAYELTASIGYAGYSADISNFQKALGEADEALYREKAARK